VKRLELQSSSYVLYRTRLEIPGCDYHWEISTIDVEKFMKNFSHSLKNPPQRRSPLNSLYETLVYQDLNDNIKIEEKKKGTVEKRRQKGDFSFLGSPVSLDSLDPFRDKKVYYYQPYDSIEEANFGHEEVVHGILSGHLFMDEQSQITDFLLNPDSGDGFEIKDYNFYPFNPAYDWEDDF